MKEGENNAGLALAKLIVVITKKKIVYKGHVKIAWLDFT